MKETRDFRRRLAKVKTRSKPLERSREFHKKEQTARKRLESFRTKETRNRYQGANRSKDTRKCRKRLEH